MAATAMGAFPPQTVDVLVCGRPHRGDLVKVEDKYGLYYFPEVGMRGLVLWLTPDEASSPSLLEEVVYGGGGVA